MRLTTAQIFNIGNILLTYVFALALLKFDPTTVGIVSAATLTAWNGVGASLTSQGAQLQTVVNNAQDPATQTALVKAVAAMPGVDNIQTNANALPALKAVAADDKVTKVLEPSK